MGRESCDCLMRFAGWFLDEVFIRIRGEQHYPARAVDQDGQALDILVQSRRNDGRQHKLTPHGLRERGRETVVADILRSRSSSGPTKT
jgi:transposase-like protein